MHSVATHIQIRANRDGRERAFIDETRVRVQDVAMLAERQAYSPDQIAIAMPHLTLAQVHAALSYYFDHREQIQQELREDEEFVEQWRGINGQSLLNRRLKSATGPAGDAVSP